MKKTYNTEHIIDSFYSKGNTKFLNATEFLHVKNRIPKSLQNIYLPFPDASKRIIYKKNIPNICICKITFNSSIKHSMILKELFNLGLKEETYGDIIVDDNIAYVYIFTDLYEDIKYNFTLNKISIKKIELLDKDYLSDFQIEYEELELLVSSLRLDNIISSITNDSRKSVLDRFKNKEIIINYEVATKPSIIIEENDVFSIRKYGKYKYNKILKNTKKGGFIISVSKYK